MLDKLLFMRIEKGASEICGVRNGMHHAALRSAREGGVTGHLLRPQVVVAIRNQRFDMKMSYTARKHCCSCSAQLAARRRRPNQANPFREHGAWQPMMARPRHFLELLLTAVTRALRKEERLDGADRTSA